MPVTRWADGPLPLLETPSQTMDVKEHASIYIANEMAFMHNAMIRGLNSIILQAPHVDRIGDIADFLFFVSAWCQWVSHHHVLEETILFPGLEKVAGAGFLLSNVSQHLMFSDNVKLLWTYGESTQPEDYDSARLLAIVDGFQSELHQHLKEEITTLLRMRKSDGPRLLRAFKQSESEANKQDKLVIPPLVLGCCDRTFEGGNSWPNTPSVTPYLVCFFLKWRHWGAWRFLPSSTWGIPRPLRFLGEDREHSSR